MKFARVIVACLLAACTPQLARSWLAGDGAVSAKTAAPQSDEPGIAAEGAPQCVPHAQALEKVGKVACVTGKVVEVHTTKTGVTYLNFCRDFRDCHFSIVVLAADARHLRDVRVLQGREIRITGKVTSYRGRAEMLWRKPEQLLVAVDETGKKK